MKTLTILPLSNYNQPAGEYVCSFLKMSREHRHNWCLITGRESLHTAFAAGSLFMFFVCMLYTERESFMTSYTEEQRGKIMQMPAAVLLRSMLADANGPIVTMREFLAGETFISNAGKMYPNNALIQYLMNNLNLPTLQKTFQNLFALGDRTAMEKECHQKLLDGLAVLGNDTEASQFKSFLIGVAEQVVSAAGGGLLGTSGPKVSQAEAAYVQQLKQMLNVPATSLP